MKFQNKDERITDFADRFRFWHGDEIADKYLRDQELMAYLNSGGFFTSPASTKYHGAYDGGLYDHSRAVMESLECMTDRMGIRWQRPESPFVVGMFHDLCKCDQYKLVKDHSEIVYHGDNSSFVAIPANYHYEYNDLLLLKEHGAKSVMILSQFMRLTEEEMLCIRYHMGAYMTDEWDQYDLAIRKYPNLLYVHTADQFASKVVGT